MNVLIVDDHSIVRMALKNIVTDMNKTSIIDEAINGQEALDKIQNRDYDLIILDISMPGISGFSVLETIKSRNNKSHILVLSMYPQEQYAMRAFRLGASGYLSKDSAYDELAIAIKKISDGGKYITSAFAEKLIFDKKSEYGKVPHEKLSERESQVMIMLAKGIPVSEIAKNLFISGKTVSTYRARILIKMVLRKNADLTLYAIKNNLIE